MSGEFDASAGNREVWHAFLLECVFVSGTKRVWNGFGPLLTLDGRLWSGVGTLISLGALTLGMSTSAPAGQIVVSGASEEMLAKAIGAASDVLDQPVITYVQSFNGRALNGLPEVLGFRFMKNMELSQTPAGEGAGGSVIRTIAVNHEGAYARRLSPPAGWYTDSDQQLRHPGDKACERTPFLVYQEEPWPVYVP